MSTQQLEPAQDSQIERFVHVLGQIAHHQVSCNRCGRPVETEGERTYFFGAQGEGVADVWCGSCTETIKYQS